MSEAVCAICLQTPEPPVGTLPCSHSFCWECIAFWAENTANRCPYCRGEFGCILREGGEEVPFEPVSADLEDYLEQPCYVCHSFEDAESLLLCDACGDRCCHIHCEARAVDTAHRWTCVYCHQITRRRPRRSRAVLVREYAFRKRPRK